MDQAQVPPKSNDSSQPSSEHSACNQNHEQNIDNSSKVLEKIAGLYADRLLSDITLEVNGKRYPAHRLILCASSDVFQVMLMNPSWSESQESNIVLMEDTACFAVFPEFLKYMYTGRIEINHFQVLPLLMLADKYNIKDLVSLCLEYQVDHAVNAAQDHQIVSWLQYARQCGHFKVSQVASDFISWNFEAVSAKSDFVAMETDVLVHFLQMSSLVVKDEYSLFEAAAGWLLYQKNRIEDDSLFEELTIHVMSHIRFPMLSPKQLARLLLNPLVVSFKDFFVEKMSAAMSYHSGKRSRDEDKDGTDYTPRLYTAEKWSSSLVIENYKNLPAYGSRTLVFQTPSSLRDETDEDMSASGHGHHEWAIDIYPKGVWFKKFLLIVWQGTLEMPEWVSKTVRLSVSAVKPGCDNARVSIGILIHGQHDGVDHVRHLVQKELHLNDRAPMVNIDDIIPYDELNGTALTTCCSNARTGPRSSRQTVNPSPFLVGKEADTLKIQITITPLEDKV
ncbi:BTB/POZ domain-containing protein 17 [Halotydeus destructor]|nr:BTB/POZ domain-containing protein 17 [Halotydeus destructor]